MYVVNIYIWPYNCPKLYLIPQKAIDWMAGFSLLRSHGILLRCTQIVLDFSLTKIQLRCLFYEMGLVLGFLTSFSLQYFSVINRINSVNYLFAYHN